MELLKKITKEQKLFISLLLLNLLPSLYQSIKVVFINLGGEDINIFGQIEWFDLINETLHAFLLVPLYYLFQKFDLKKEKKMFSQIFVLIITVYISFLGYCYFNIENLTSIMESTVGAEIYLKLETIGFIFEVIYSISYIIFLYLDDYKTVFKILLVKLLLMVFMDLIIINYNISYGPIFASIFSQVVISIFCVYLLYKENIIINPLGKLEIKKDILSSFLFIGIMQGISVAISNIMYATEIIKFINKVSETGNYWLANNYIWNYMLIPSIVLADIIKIRCLKKDFLINKYIRYTIFIMMISFAFILFLEPFLRYIMFIKDPLSIANIIRNLLLFYFIYMFGMIFESVLIGKGKNYILLGVNIIVNIIYYPLVIYLNVFDTSIYGICNLFGYGVALSSVLYVFTYLIFEKKLISE